MTIAIDNLWAAGPPPPEFSTFNTQHLIVLLILVALGVFIAWGVRQMRTGSREWFGRALGCLLLAYAIALYYQKATSGDLRVSYSLPMQLCDWVLIACLITLFSRNTFMDEIAYFWGAGGTLQAVLTPDIVRGFPSWRFIQFFWGHGLILLSIVYILAGREFRPRPRSILRMMIAVNAYGVAALSLDLAFGWNYGYLMSKPSAASLLDYLGPWPWYLAWLEVISLATFWLLSLPWKIRDWLRTRRRRNPQSQGGQTDVS